MRLLFGLVAVLCCLGNLYAEGESMEIKQIPEESRAQAETSPDTDGNTYTNFNLKDFEDGTAYTLVQDPSGVTVELLYFIHGWGEMADGTWFDEMDYTVIISLGDVQETYSFYGMSISGEAEEIKENFYQIGEYTVSLTTRNTELETINISPLQVVTE